MGQPKALLPFDPDDTFVSRICRTLHAARLAEILVVVRPGDDALADAVGRLEPPPTLVVNPIPARGQLSSLVAGLDAADARGAEALLVLPVDIPMVRTDTIARLLAAAAASAATIVRATHGSRHGHPVIFKRALFETLRRADLRLGARAVLHAHAADLLDVELDDPGVLCDVDRPEDYARLFGRSSTGREG